jgi:quinol monooxygenase YgiN
VAINVVAVLKAKPGFEDKVGAAGKTLVEASRKDPGCIRYDLYQAKGAPGTFVMQESWESQELLDAHMKAPHLGAAFATLGDAFAEGPQIYLLDAFDVS